MKNTESRNLIFELILAHLKPFVDLNFSLRRFYHIENQSIDLLCKSMEWFLHNRDLRHEKVYFNVSQHSASTTAGKRETLKYSQKNGLK